MKDEDDAMVRVEDDQIKPPDKVLSLFVTVAVAEPCGSASVFQPPLGHNHMVYSFIILSTFISIRGQTQESQTSSSSLIPPGARP